MLYQVLKHEAQPSVLGLDTTRIANFVNYLKNFMVYPQEPITRSVQLPYIPVTAYSQTDLFLA